MPLIICTKFQTNQIILTLFSGVWDKNPTPVAEKVVKGRLGNRVNKAATTVMLQITAWGVYKIFRARGRGVLSRGRLFHIRKNDKNMIINE